MILIRKTYTLCNRFVQSQVNLCAFNSSKTERGKVGLNTTLNTRACYIFLLKTSEFYVLCIKVLALERLQS